MFTPQWPSDDDELRGDGNGNENDGGDGRKFDSNNTSDTHKPTMNGTSGEHGPGGAPPPSAEEGEGGIELTHDPLTGVSIQESPSKAGENNNMDGTASEDDEAGNQCQMWQQQNPQQEEEDDSGGGIEVNASAFGDIWSSEAFGFHATSPLKDLLDSDDYTLEDLLGQDELLQELRGCEARLVEYFGRPEVVAGLVRCLMVEVPGNGSREGRARWCAEEERRREAERSNAAGAFPEEDANSSMEGAKATVYDASSPKQEERMLRVEAEWNSPTKGGGGGRPGGEWMSSALSPEGGSDRNRRGSEGGGGGGLAEFSRSPSEEYDLRFLRYPYMACEVLCSEAGTTIDVLVDGYVEDLDVLALPGGGGGGGRVPRGSANSQSVGSRSAGGGRSVAQMMMGVINDDEDSLLGEDDDEADGGGDDDALAALPAIQPRKNRQSLSSSESSGRSALASSLSASEGSSRTLPPGIAAPLSQLGEEETPPPPPPTKRILDVLFAPLVDSSPSRLDDRRAGYLERILTVLYRRRGQGMADYVNSPLVVTGRSVGMAGFILGSLDEENASWVLGGGSAHSSTPPSTIDPLSRQASSFSCDDDETAAPFRRPPLPRFPSPHAPPMLMCALFDHLHSHSVMHIVQRLLLPSPMRAVHRRNEADLATPFAAAGGSAGGDVAAAEGDSAMSNDDDDDDDDDNPNRAMNNQFMSTLNAMNNGVDPGGGNGNRPSMLPPTLPGNDAMGDDDDDEMDDEEEEDPMGLIFQCDWSERRVDQALELLVRRLEGDTSSFLMGCGFPVGYDVGRELLKSEASAGNVARGGDCEMNGDSQHLPPEEEEEDAQESSLSCSQHASEILVTIIQNSSLDSPVMLRLSSDPALRRVVDLVVRPQPSAAELVPHESVMTCAVTVLESLVLQLGGYGAVVAPAATAGGASGNEGGAGEGSAASAPAGAGENMVREPNGQSMLLTEIGPHTPPPSAAGASSESSYPGEGAAIPQMANNDTLLRHAPALLARLSDLLSHPVTKTWTIPAQYSSDEPRPLLGSSRLRILRLVESLVLLGDPRMDEALRESDALEKCLELFWQFEWCSMLHQSVANLLVHVFEGGEGRYALQEYFLVRCNLLQRLMDSFSAVISSSPSSAADCQVVGGDITKDSLPDDGNGGDDDVTSPRYGEMMLSMKTMYSEKGAGVTSSMESEHGSQSDDGNNDVEDYNAFAPVSEDDVDSAMEKECQEGGQSLLDMADGAEDSAAESTVHTVTNNSSPSLQPMVPNQTCFRKGYMGHVIIICQALVHACNNTVISETGFPGVDGTETMEQADSPLKSPLSMDEISEPSSFDSLAVQAPNTGDESALGGGSNSKKRKDRSPVRDGSEDIKRLASSPVPTSPTSDGNDLFASAASPIPKLQTSPNDRGKSSDAALATGGNDDAGQKPVFFDHILQCHPLFDRWQNFVASVLVSEMSVQATPLGGQHGEMGAASPDGPSDMGILPPMINDDGDNDFLGIGDDGNTSPCVGSGAIGGLIVGEIDMDENDLDIAASMMEALSLPPSSNGGLGLAQPVGHNRRRGVIGGGGSLLGNELAEKGSGGGIGNFGAVIQQPSASFSGYVYDDPLGGIHPFEEEETNIMSDAEVVSRDGVSKQHIGKNGSIKRSESTSSDDNGDEDDDEDDDDDDDDVPVMDLFAGSFEPNFANFDAFENANDNPFDNSEKANDSAGNDFFTSGGTDNAKDDPFQFTENPFDLVDTLSSEVDNGGTAK